MDRIGPTRPLLVLTALFAVAVAALITAVETAQPLPVLVLLALVTGLTQPALPAASRALWGVLLPSGPGRDAAYTYEAISLEVFFIIGPAFAAFLVLAPWPGTGLVVAALAMVLGALGFALSRPVRDRRRATGAVPGRPARRARRPAMRTVALASLGFGLVVGTVEVGVPAVTAAVGSPALGGVLISAWSVTSVLAGVLYSLRPWPRPLHLRMPVLLGAFAVLVGAMALVGPTGSLVVLTRGHARGRRADHPAGDRALDRGRRRRAGRHRDRGLRLGDHRGHARAGRRAVGGRRRGRGGRAAGGVPGRRVSPGWCWPACSGPAGARCWSRRIAPVRAWPCPDAAPRSRRCR